MKKVLLKICNPYTISKERYHITIYQNNNLVTDIFTDILGNTLVELTPYKLYKLKIISKKDCYYKQIVITNNHTLIIPLCNKERKITIKLTDYYYEGLPIKKGYIILKLFILILFPFPIFI